MPYCVVCVCMVNCAQLWSYTHSRLLPTVTEVGKKGQTLVVDGHEDRSVWG